MTLRLQLPPDAHRSAALRRAGWALLTASLLLGLAHACADSVEVDTRAWPERDLLGLEPSWVTPLPEADRAELRQRLTARALAQADDSAWAHAPNHPAGDHIQRDTRRLDAERAEADQAPLVIAWATHDPDGPGAWSCPIEPEDLAALPPEGDGWSAGWALDDAFQRPIAGARTEHDALRARLPWIERWITRCAEAYGEPLGVAARLSVVRAQGAPLLVSYWPQHRRVLVNPLLLWLWHEVDMPRPAWQVAIPRPELRTAQNPLGLADLDECVAELNSYCDTCGSEGQVSRARREDRDACEDTLLDEGTVWENCQALDYTIAYGFMRLCLNRQVVAAQSGVNFYSCPNPTTSEQRNLAYACGINPVTTLDELGNNYRGFVDPATAQDCVAGFESCLETANTYEEPEEEQDPCAGCCGEEEP